MEAMNALGIEFIFTFVVSRQVVKRAVKLLFYVQCIRIFSKLLEVCIRNVSGL